MMPQYTTTSRILSAVHLHDGLLYCSPKIPLFVTFSCRRYKYFTNHLYFTLACKLPSLDLTETNPRVFLCYILLFPINHNAWIPLVDKIYTQLCIIFLLIAPVTHVIIYVCPLYLDLFYSILQYMLYKRVILITMSSLYQDV